MNRIILHLRDGLSAAKRRRSALLEMCSAVGTAATISGKSTVELAVSSVESFAEGNGRVEWYFPCAESDHGRSAADVYDAAAIAADMRRLAARFTQAAALLAVHGE